MFVVVVANLFQVFLTMIFWCCSGHFCCCCNWFNYSPIKLGMKRKILSCCGTVISFPAVFFNNVWEKFTGFCLLLSNIARLHCLPCFVFNFPRLLKNKFFWQQIKFYEKIYKVDEAYNNAVLLAYEVLTAVVTMFKELVRHRERNNRSVRPVLSYQIQCKWLVNET